MVAYVDSSAVIRRVMDGPGSDVVLDIWGRAEEVCSSEVVRGETLAALGALRRSGRLDAAGLERMVRKAEGVLGELRLILGDESIDAAARGLAGRHALGGRAAVHLAAALSVDAPRIVVTTWDRSLAKGASQCGMPVVPALD
jgi:hypothetical protein